MEEEEGSLGEEGGLWSVDGSNTLLARIGEQAELDLWLRGKNACLVGARPWVQSPALPRFRNTAIKSLRSSI